MQWTCHRRRIAVVLTALGCLSSAWVPSVCAQGILPDLNMPAPPSVPTASLVTAIELQGNQQTSETRIRSMIKSRVGREFDAEMIQSDVRRLAASGLFRDVRILTNESQEGITVTFQLQERPRIEYIKFLGNQSVRDKTLLKKSELSVEGTLNKYLIEEARVRLEEYYHGRGHGKASVEVVEGLAPEDKGVVFMVHEGPLARIWQTDFVGNTIASDSRLKTQIQSKPGFAWLIKGQLDKSQLEQDVDSLTAYYRSLGFFKAQINRIVEYSDTGKWVTVRFIIDEGPRYEVRNISFVGHTRFTNDQLASQLKMEPGQPFDQKKMNADIAAISDLYGSQGYIHADIEAAPRFLEQPGQLDLVYDIREGDQYRVGNIHVQITGETPHTKQATILNRLSLQPGEIIDIRKIRDDERRIKASQLFVNEPHRGITPTIKISPPELTDSDVQMAGRPGGSGTYRGQNPPPENYPGHLPPAPAGYGTPSGYPQPSRYSEAPAWPGNSAVRNY